MKTYVQTSPSGLPVASNVEFPKSRWWDGRVLHIVWSYASWATLILSAHGVKGPRNAFLRHWSR